MMKKNFHLLFWVVTFTVLLLGAVQSFSSPAASTTTGPLIINEILVSNGAGLTDEDGDHSDWIEIYNRSNRPVNLSGYALTDDLDQPQKWLFPNLTLAGRTYLVIFASGKNRNPATEEAPLHTNFRLNKSGESLGLYNTLAGRFEDRLELPPQFRDMAYGRYRPEALDPAAELPFAYLAHPTPGQINDETQWWSGSAAGVEFSQPRGFYETPLWLELTTATPGASIFYTSDGSAPTESSGRLYTGPIAITTTTAIRAIAVKPGLLTSASSTHSYILLDDILRQPANPPGFPETWGVYAQDYGEYKEGTPVMADYEMDPEVVNNPRYKHRLKEDLKSIPTLSLVTAIQNLDIYGQPRQRGEAYERPVSVELIYPDEQPKNFQIEAGLRIQGGWGRWEFIPKHSFRLFFKQKYGPAKLEHPLFPDSPVEKFDTLVLRSGVDESYAGKPDPDLDHRLDTYTRDEWLRASQRATSGVGSHGIFVHLYLNGLYWGLYNLVERPDASFLSAYLGGAKEDWFAIKHGFTLVGPDQMDERGEIINGSSERFEQLQALVNEGNFEDRQKYAAVRSYLDVPHFIDYIILAWYSGRLSNWTENNWYAGMRNPDGQLKYFIWDGEKTWSEGARIDFGRITDQPSLIRQLFTALMKNPDFRVEFADRLYRHLANEGALTDASAKARWQKINHTIDGAIVAESARWGDTRTDSPITRDDWLKAQANVLGQMEGNAARLLASARAAGYYPQLDSPRFNRSGGLIEPGFVFTISLPPSQNPAHQPTIVYTNDGSDPRLAVSGAVSPNAQEYVGPLVLTTTIQLKARAFVGDPADGSAIWSALNEATFKVVAANSQLRITEIMYNPPGDDDYEFIELYNGGQAEIELANLFFEGIRFTFPPDQKPLGPGEFIVLVRNRAAFTARYPDVLIGGVFEGQLSNQGERLTLKDHQGETILTVEYDDDNGWPLSPDGRGDSLTLIDLDGDPDHPKNWRASTRLFGSPGATDP